MLAQSVFYLEVLAGRYPCGTVSSFACRRGKGNGRRGIGVLHAIRLEVEKQMPKAVVPWSEMDLVTW